MTFQVSMLKLRKHNEGVEDGKIPRFNIRGTLDVKMRPGIEQSLHRNRRREISDG